MVLSQLGVKLVLFCQAIAPRREGGGSSPNCIPVAVTVATLKGIWAEVRGQRRNETPTLPLLIAFLLLHPSSASSSSSSPSLCSPSTTPFQGYIPQDPGILPDTPMDTTPLRVTVSAIPSHLSTSSPLPVSPIAISPLYTPAQSIQGTPVASYYVSQPTTPLVLQPITPVQVHPQHVFGTPLLPTGGPQGISYVQTQESPLGGPSASAGFLPLRTSTLLRTPMARLGYSDPDGTRYSQFPDIGVLEPVSQTPVNQEFFRRELVDTWWTNDQIQKQVNDVNTLNAGCMCTCT